MNRDRESRVYNAAFLIFATYVIYIIRVNATGKDGLTMCFTGDINDPDVFALTSCPVPPSSDDIGEMQRVGSKFAELFANVTAALSLNGD